MLQYCTREQVREVDRRAIEELGLPGLVLMENAGRGAAMVAAEMLGNPAGKRVVIFCGKGNNGGDGFVVARHLHNMGARVELALAFAADELYPEGDAGINLTVARRMELPMHAVLREEEIEALKMEKQADLIVDALLGTGAAGQVREPYLTLIRTINAADRPVLAIDLPSGLDCNTGRILGAAVRATRTATFVLPKIGFTLEEGPALVGKLHVIDIGVPLELLEEME